MPIFGPAGCLDLLEGEFRILYPIFNRRVEYFQVVREQGESSKEFYRRLTRLSDMADLEAMSKEELNTFRFFGACDDKILRNKIFNLKRKDATAVRDAIAQHDLQQKANDALTSKSLTAVKQGKNESRQKQYKKGKEWVGLPPELEGRCAACGDANYLASNCHVRKNRTICKHCGLTGHLAKVCFSALQGKPKTTKEARPQPLRAIMGPTDDIEDQEPWVNRLTLNVSHKMGSFTFHTFPDTGSAATLIAADLAKKQNISPTKPSFTKYINVSEDPVPTLGTAPVQLSTSRRVSNTNAVVTPCGRFSRLNRFNLENYPLPIFQNVLYPNSWITVLVNRIVVPQVCPILLFMACSFVVPSGIVTPA